MHKILKNKTLLSIVQRIIKNELISGSFYIILASFLSNILAAVLNIFLAKKLPLGDYGIFAALLPIVTLISIPAQSFNTIIVQFATKYFASGDKEKALKLYVIFFRIIFLIGILLFFAFLFASAQVAEFLQIKDASLIILVGVIAGLSYMNIVNTAFLQSMLRFGIVALLLFFGTVLKLFFGVTFVLMGYRVGGVLWALILMTFIPFIFSFLPIKFLFKHRANKKIEIPVKEILAYTIPASIGILCLTSLTSVDIILVKHFFSPGNAELYAGAALMGKIVFYASMPIPMVMFPLVIKRRSNGLPFNSLFLLALALVTTSSVSITTLYYFFPKFFVSIFLGFAKYHAVTQYITFFGIYLTMYSILNVIVMFLLSLKHTKIAYLVGLTALLQIVLINFFHKDFFEIISISLGAIVLLLISLLVYYFGKYGQKTS